MPNKYGNVKTELDGFLFDSKREAHRYWELKMLERAGEISDLELQPQFPIVINQKKVATYIADFRYKEKGQVVIEDAKGMRTDVYILKKKIVEALYSIKIVEV